MQGIQCNLYRATPAVARSQVFVGPPQFIRLLRQVMGTEDLDSHWNNFVSECMIRNNVRILKELLVSFYLLVCGLP